jgi:TetR/AcrR family transcriptional regulator, repressor for uid operon
MPKLSETQQGERRDRIVEAAERCFARAGFHRTTMQDICREAGISAGALYLYFDSKEALIAGIVERDRQEFLKSFAMLDREPDMLQGLRRLMVECIVNRPRQKTTLFVEMGAESIRNPAVARTLAECDAAIGQSLLGYLEQATREGRLAPTMPLAEVLQVMELIADGMFWRQAIMPDFDAHAAVPVVLAALAPLLGAPAHAAPSLVPDTEGATL